MAFLFGVWLIDFLGSVFLIPWLFVLLRLPEKYLALYEIFFGYFFFTAPLIMILVWHYKLTLKDLGFASIPQPLRTLCLFIAGVGFLFIAEAAFLLLTDLSKISGPLKRLVGSQFGFDGAPYLKIIEGIIVAPILEEIFYRGVIQAVLFRRFKSKVQTVLLTSLLFTLVHSNFNWLNLPEQVKFSYFLTTSPAGSLVYGSFFYLGGNNILLPILLHSFTNVIGL